MIAPATHPQPPLHGAVAGYAAHLGGTAVHLQPIVDLRTLAVVGYEAQRASDPGASGGGTRDVFGPGLGRDLELAVVADELRALQRLPEPRFIATSISPATVLDPRLGQVLATVDPSRVLLQVSAHLAVDDYGCLRQALALPRAHGLRLAVSDAGAGFAGFQHLVQLSPDRIKLGRRWTAALGSDTTRRCLVTALAGFAAETGSAMIAEGIETGAELALLLEMGIRYGQGDLLGRPAALTRTQDQG